MKTTTITSINSLKTNTSTTHYYHLYQPPEIEDRMRTQVAIGAGTTVMAVTTNDHKQFLRDVLSWLVVNSMRVDGIQFSLLCEQSVSNIWRKRSFNMLRSDYQSLDKV